MCVAVSTIRGLKPPPDPTPEWTDDEIRELLTEEVCELYSGRLIRTSKHRLRAIALHAAHIIWLTNNSPTAGPVPFGAPVNEADLKGVGKLKFAIANVNPADLANLLLVPSPYLGRLLMKRAAMSPAARVV